MGNEDYTAVDDSCEYMNNHIADIGVNLHDQFADNFSRQEYEKVYERDGSDEDIIFDRNDIFYVVNSSDVNKSSGIDYLPTFVLKDCFIVQVP